jgi:hypothetical protein
MQTLTDLGPSKLLDDEQDRIRIAVDNLLFSRDLKVDLAARDALSEIGHLCLRLVESGRWEQATAARLAHDVAECGPPPPGELQAA